MQCATLTKPLYMENPLLTDYKAKVTEIGEINIKSKPYHWVQLDETIFHPQGGGQPSDQGTINGISVDLLLKVVKGAIDTFEIQHCFLQKPPFEIGQEVDLSIDKNVRALNMRMHTAGHAIADFVQSAFPNLKAIGGNHFPKDGYMKFKVSDSKFPQASELKERIEEAFMKAKEENMPCSIQNDQGRKLKIGNFEGVPCGGTHLSAVSDIGNLIIGQIKNNNKESTITIKYKVE